MKISDAFRLQKTTFTPSASIYSLNKTTVHDKVNN